VKLSTRLSIVVAALVTVLSLAIGSFAIASSQNSEIRSITSVLNASAKETYMSHEDKFSVALNVSESSPLPLSVALLTRDPNISYLVENQSSIMDKPLPSEIQQATTREVLVENSFYIRTIKTEANQYLIFSVSIKSAQDHSKSLFHNLFIFILCAICLSIMITYLIFRRDSKINELARLLKENNQRMQEFLGDASHELRTPLTVIKGYAELISANPDHADVPRYLETVKVESARMEKLIADLLLLAELGEGREPVYSEVELAQIIETKIQELRDLNPHRKITSECTDISLLTDLPLCEKLLGNIFSNIVRHTPQDAAVNIELSSRNGRLYLIIEDGGPGLPNYTIQTFTRFDKSRSRESGGTGLGLSIMQGIAETLDMKIEFSKSELGGLKITIQQN